MENVKLLKSTVRGLSRRYESLKKINSLLTETGTSYAFIDGVLALVIEMFSAEGGGVFLKDGQQELKLEVFRAHMPNKKEKEAKKELEGKKVEVSQTPLKRIKENNYKSFTEEKIKETASYRKMAARFLGGINSAAAAAVRTGYADVGIIEIYNFPSFSEEKEESLASIGNQIGINLEILRRLESLRERSRVMRELTSITEAISEPSHLDAVLDMIIKSMLDFFSADGCSIFLKDNEGNIEFAAVSGEKKDILQGEKINSGEGIVGWSIENDSPVLMGNVSKDKRFSPRVDEATGMKTGSIICAPLKVLNEVTGAVEAVREDASFSFNEEDLGLLTIIASHASLAIDKSRMYGMKVRWLRSVVDLLTRAVDSKDSRFPGHSGKVRRYVSLIASRLGLTPEEAQSLDIAAAVKDVGKLATPDRIMEKKEKLSEEEWETLRQYPVKSVEILEAIEDFGSIIPIIKNHCENFDGSGYPQGLSGEEIPRLSRILGVADAFAAMTSKRPYREALSDEEAREEMENNKGKIFDPEIVEAFLCALDRKKEKNG